MTHKYLITVPEEDTVVLTVTEEQERVLNWLNSHGFLYPDTTVTELQKIDNIDLTR